MTPSRFNQLNRVQTGPKPINYTPLWFAAVLFSFIFGVMATRLYESHHSTINIPEEAALIKPTDNLKGEWKDGVLYIEFNNPQNK